MMGCELKVAGSELLIVILIGIAEIALHRG